MERKNNSITDEALYLNNEEKKAVYEMMLEYFELRKNPPHAFKSAADKITNIYLKSISKFDKK